MASSRSFPGHDDQSVMTYQELKAERKKRQETRIVRIICREFDIPIRDVCDASYSSCGEEGRLTMTGLDEVVDTPFPMEVTLEKTIKKGKTKPLSHGRFMRHPLLYTPLRAFCRLVDHTEKPLLLLAADYRFKSFIAVTNFPMPSAFRCFGLCVDLQKAGLKKHQTGDSCSSDQKNGAKLSFTFGVFENMLQAMRCQEFWVPFLDL